MGINYLQFASLFSTIKQFPKFNLSIQQNRTYYNILFKKLALPAKVLHTINFRNFALKHSLIVSHFPTPNLAVIRIMSLEVPFSSLKFLTSCKRALIQSSVISLKKVVREQKAYTHISPEGRRTTCYTVYIYISSKLPRACATCSQDLASYIQDEKLQEEAKSLCYV